MAPAMPCLRGHLDGPQHIEPTSAAREHCPPYSCGCIHLAQSLKELLPPFDEESFFCRYLRGSTDRKLVVIDAAGVGPGHVEAGAERFDRLSEEPAVNR